jgi:hypothetical protein
VLPPKPLKDIEVVEYGWDLQAYSGYRQSWIKLKFIRNDTDFDIMYAELIPKEITRHKVPQLCSSWRGYLK